MQAKTNGNSDSNRIGTGTATGIRTPVTKTFPNFHSKNCKNVFIPKIDPKVIRSFGFPNKGVYINKHTIQPNQPAKAWRYYSFTKRKEKKETQQKQKNKTIKYYLSILSFYKGTFPNS